MKNLLLNRTYKFVCFFLVGFTLSIIFSNCSKTSGDPAPVVAKTGQFTINGTTYSGSCSSVPDVGAGGPLGNIDVLIAHTSGSSFIVYNMPKQSSGTYTFTDGYANVGGSALYALCTLPTASYASVAGGSITKTGANTFTFSCQVYFISTPATKITVTGSGTY